MTRDTLAISVQGLTKRFGNREVVRNCSIDVPYGTIYGFLGPNGTGKTTTIRMLCGLLIPDGGEGRCLGYDLRTQAHLIKKQVGYMPQRFGLYDDLTIRENLAFVARLYDMPAPQEAAEGALERLGLTNRANQLAGQLSGGWKQRLSLAACTLHKPQLLLLDEPTAGVDPSARREFWDEIHTFAAEGITTLVSTHYMDEAERCHQIGYLSEGRLLVHGSVAEVIGSSNLSTWQIEAKDSAALKPLLKALPGVEMVTNFGGVIHVAGTQTEKIEKGLLSLAQEHQATLRQVPPTLEDVFIHTMTTAALSEGQEKGRAA